MAIVKYGAIVTEIKGKVGGQVFQGGRSGGTMRNSRTKRRLRVKATRNLAATANTNFSIVAKSWSLLTSVERQSWDSLIGVWTFTNRFGEVYNGTAYQIYCAWGLNSLYADIPLTVNPNTSESVVDVNVNIADYSLSGTWDFSNSVNPPKNVTLVMQVSYPQNQSKNIGSISFRKFGISNINNIFNQDLKAPYESLIGYAPKIGDKIVIKLWQFYADYPKKQFLQIINSTVVA